MSENIGNATPFSSGGHRWVWGEREQAVKEIQTVGTTGAARLVLRNGARSCVVEGYDGAPAVLTAADDAGMNVLEAAIEALVSAGTPAGWEDAAGRTGTALVVTRFVRVGHRHVSIPAGAVWQFYRCHVRDLVGDLVPVP